MSARRDVQEAGRNARGKQAEGARGRATVTGADETVVRVNGETTVIGVVTDAETGQVLGLDVLMERDADGFMERLGDFARDCGDEAMSGDDFSAYKPVVERLGIDHQICIAHARKRAAGRPVDEQCDGARDRQKQDKAQDGQWVQERRLDAERVWA